MLLAGCAGTAPATSETTSTTASSAVGTPLGASSTAASSEAVQTSVELTGDATETFVKATDVVAQEGGATNPLCELFTIDEAAALLGAPVDPGVDAAMGSGCQWNGSDGSGATYLQIQVLDDPSYYVEQSLGAGFEQLAGIGDAAFLIPELGGYAASAQTATATFAVAVNGGTASKTSATELLRQVVQRY